MRRNDVKMTNFYRAVNVGIKAGIIYAITSIIFELILLVFYWRDILTSLGYDVSTIPETDFMNAVGNIFPSFILSQIIGGIIFGILFVLVYATIYKSIPGFTSIKKALLLSLIAWGLLTILPNKELFDTNLEFFIVGSVLVGLTNSLIFGYFIGIFWDRHEKIPKPSRLESDSNSQ